MNKQTRIGIVIAVFLGVPFLINQWQTFRSTNDFSTRDDSGEIVESGSIGVFAVQVGDCLLMPSTWRGTADNSTEVRDVRGVPCTDLHDAEVVGETTFDDSSYPGEEELFSRMDTFCVSAYENYTGVSFDDSPHNYLALVPTSESWTQGDRKGHCYAHNVEDKQLGASIRK